MRARRIMVAEPAARGRTRHRAHHHHDGEAGEDHFVRQAEIGRDDATHDAEHVEGGAPADELGDGGIGIAATPARRKRNRTDAVRRSIRGAVFS
jgi:hypothetical protein